MMQSMLIVIDQAELLKTIGSDAADHLQSEGTLGNGLRYRTDQTITEGSCDVMTLKVFNSKRLSGNRC